MTNRFFRIISIATLVCFNEVAISDDVIHNDLIPLMINPDSSESLKGMALRLEELHDYARLDKTKFLVEMQLHIFERGNIGSISLLRERGTPDENGFWIEYKSFVSDKSEMIRSRSQFRITDELAQNYSSAWRNFLFRTNYGAWNDRLLHDDDKQPWLLVSGFHTQGMTYGPYVDSPLGRLLGITLQILKLDEEGIPPSELALKILPELESIIAETDCTDRGVWILNVRDPYVEIFDDTKFRRFSLNRLFVD